MRQATFQDFNSLLAEARLFFGHPNYLAIGPAIEGKKAGLRALFYCVRALSRIRVGNALLVVGALLFSRSCSRPSCEIFQLGGSENNRRVFSRLNAAAGLPELDSFINGKPISIVGRLRAVFRLGDVWSVARSLTRMRLVSAFGQTQLLLTGAAAILYKYMNFEKVSCVCIACDHSPIAMALVQAARRNRVATCYVQHAPVADYFPPLDYDLSVLFDRASKSRYEEAALNRRTTTRGNVVLLPPFEEDFRSPSFKSPPLVVGICLSYLVNIEALSQLVAELLRSKNVQQIRLRRHPRCVADLAPLMLDSRVRECPRQALGKFSEKIDFALVPNSGVAIELLHLGVPVAYTPDVDFITYDYYGFVADGILPIFHSSILLSSQDLLTFFDEAWRRRYRAYDETVSITLREAQARAGTAFNELIECALRNKAF